MAITTLNRGAEHPLLVFQGGQDTETAVRGRIKTRPRMLPANRIMVCALVAIPAGETLLAWLQVDWLDALWGFLCLAAGFATAVHLWLRPEPLPKGTALLASATLPLAGLLELCFTHPAYRFATELATLRWLSLASLLFAGLRVLRSSRCRDMLLSGLLWFGVAATAFEIVQIFGYDHYQTMETGFPLLSSNYYAELIELLLPIALTRAFNRGSNTLMYAIVGTIFIATVLASGARAGSVLVLLELALVFVLARQVAFIPAKRLVALGILLPTLLGGLIVLEGPQTLLKRLQDQDPLAGRREITQASVAMFKAYPLQGTGLGTFEYVYPAFATFDNGYSVPHAHNDWLELAIEGGVFFPVCLLCVLLSVAIASFRSMWGVGIFVLALHSFVDFPLQRLGVLTTLFVLIATLAASSIKAAESKSRLNV